VFRISHIIVAVIALGAAGLAIVYLLGRPSDSRSRNLLAARSAEILRRNNSDTVIVPLQDLFGGDIDGVCTVWNGPVDETAMRSGSPAQFGAAISAIAKMQAAESTVDSDARYWVIHAVKGAAVLRTYRLANRSAMDLYRTDAQANGLSSGEPENRCFDRNVSVQLNLYAGEGKALIIKVPAEPPAASR
jgi:hypothetical protein